MLLGIFSYSVNSGGQLYLHLTSLQQMLVTMTPRTCWKCRDGHVQLTPNSTGSHGSLAQELGPLRAEPRQFLPDMCHPWLFSIFIFWSRVSHLILELTDSTTLAMFLVLGNPWSLPLSFGTAVEAAMEDGNSNSKVLVCVASTCPHEPCAQPPQKLLQEFLECSKYGILNPE